MKTELSNEKIILKQLTANDSTVFHNLYFDEKDTDIGQSSKTIEKQTPLDFTKRIISLCNNIFTIRLINNPTKIIGDCALHDLNKETNEIEIGGTLLPEYWGKGIMASAFNMLIDFARQEYGVQKIVAKTDSTNDKALKFADKIGLKKVTTENKTIILERVL
ncbi:GNAT family N-acetyltransferase [Sphingobacterium lactis]|uniref:GNAT family N-acetyltransferase n=1 Tax=Sphingobacterium lactis TaxID=797291 RepID=UPI003DA21885